MSITSIKTAQSSLQAYNFALENSAHNVANANTKGFQSQQVQFNEASQGGVVVNLSPKGQELNAVVQEDTNLPESDTDLAKELVQNLEFKTGFLISAKLIQAENERLGSLIDISE